jgi:hypothetical protein
MLIRPEERDGYLNFIALNTSLWRIEDGVLDAMPADRIVIVDLLSHDLHQAIRALYVGKILQRVLGCRPVGVVGNLLFSQDLAFGYDKAEAFRLARSYGITEFIDLEEAGPNDISDATRYFTPDATAQVIGSIAACPDEELADLVLGWRTPAGCRIGEYVYETVPRITRDPFLSNTRERLADVVREAHRIHNIVVERCQNSRVEAFTAGHISYTQWGMVADLVIRAGGKAIWFDCTGNFSAYRLDRPPHGKETLSSLVRQIDRDLFERAFRGRARLDPRFVAKVQGLFSSDYFLRPFWWEPTRPPPKPLLPLLRRIALAKLGWPDARCPVVCIFLHCLSDLPRDDEQIHLDYYDWLVETLRIAATDTSRKWIFKTHPANRGGYDKTNATERLKAEYQQHKHIFFLDDELEKVEVFAVCDLTVTIRGSIAYEMSVYGKPVLLAGRSPYSDLGFCHVAHSADEYRALLASDPESLALTPDMHERASFYLIYDKIASRIESTFMPYWTYRLTGDNNIWNALSERILYNISDLDPVMPALEALLNGGAARTGNPRYRDLLRTQQAAEAPEPGRAASEAREPGDVLTFAREGSGLRDLLSRPVAVDAEGSWYGPNQEACIGLVLRGSERAPAGARLGLRMQFFCGPVDSDLYISVNGGELQYLSLPGGGLRTEVVDLGINATGDDAIVVRAWLVSPGAGKIDFRLDAVTFDTLGRLRPAKPGVLGFATRLFERMGL